MAATETTVERGRLLRYIVNGLIATLVHYAVLRLALEVLRIPTADIANLGTRPVRPRDKLDGLREVVYGAD